MPDMMPSDPASTTDATAATEPVVRFLKILVTVLTAVMILGLVAIVGLLVTRLGGGAPLPVLPQLIRLPEGTSAEAVTIARDYTVVLTDQHTVLLFRKDGTLAQTVTIGN